MGQCILHKVNKDLKQNGINAFDNIKPCGNNQYVCKCPIHKSGLERKPSFTFNQELGLYYCFTCLAKGHINYLIKNIYKSNGLKIPTQFLANSDKAYSYDNIDDELNNLLNELNGLDKDYSLKDVMQDIFSEQDLLRNQINSLHSYLIGRGITDLNLLKLLKVAIINNKLFFPVYNERNKYLGYFSRNISNKILDCKYKNSRSLKKDFLYGEGLLKEAKTIFVVEGVFDYLSLMSLDIPSVALLGLGSKQQYEKLKQLPAVNIVLALDNDSRGIEASNQIINELQNSPKLTHRLDICKIGQFKDINELFVYLSNLKCPRSEVRSILLKSIQQVV